MNPKYRFRSEFQGVYGATRPGSDSESVSESEVNAWISFMQAQGIRRVCCLLDDRELKFFQTDLLGRYRSAFGKENVLHSPIIEYTIIEDEQWTQEVLPFIRDSVESNVPVLVHCSLGVGRTGQVLQRAAEALAAK